MTRNETQEGQPGIAKAALSALCPQCGSKTLYAGLTRFANRCPTCGLDFDSFNVGDGPAAFLTMGIAAIIIVLAILLDIAARPPFWVHAVIWIPVTTAMTVWSLRVAKAALLAAEFRNRAGEGRRADDA